MNIKKKIIPRLEIKSGNLVKGIRMEGLRVISKNLEIYLKKYEGEFPKRYANDCFKFMGYTHDEAMKIIDKFRPEHLWKKKNNKWIRKQEIF